MIGGHTVRMLSQQLRKNIFLQKFEAEWTTWLYVQVQVGQHAKYGGFWCKNVDCTTYWSRVNVQLRLVCAQQ
jgi:hypothetical protein